MVDTKTTNLAPNTGPTLNDLFMMVDVDDPTMSVAGTNVKVSGTEYLELLIAYLAQRAQVINVQTGTSYTPTLQDSAAVIVCTNAGDIDFILSEDASVDHADGTYMDVIQGGTGQVYFVPEGGIASYRTVEQGSLVRVRKLGADSWHVSGKIETV